MDHNCPGNIRGKSLQAMTTRELEELLRREQDAEGMPDVELIEAVLAVLDARGGAPAADVDAAWDDFRKHYSSEAPLYSVPDEAFDRADTQTDTIDHPSIPTTKPTERKRWLRVAVAVAAVLILIFGSTLSNTATGMNLWEAIAQWTSETFGLRFGKSEREIQAVNPELTDLYRIVLNTDNHVQIVPRYLPEGYTCADLNSDGKQIAARFVKDENYIFIQYFKVRRDNGEQFQRDDGSAEEYIAGGITHHMSTNLGKIIAVWANDGWECSILGAPSKEELLRMIDSIYSED